MGKIEWKTLMLLNKSITSWEVLYCSETEHRGKYPSVGKKEKLRPEVKERFAEDDREMVSILNRCNNLCNANTCI